RLDAYHQAASEVTRYHATIDAVNELGRDCQGGRPPEDAKERYRYLASFESTPERDAAIVRLEPCRRALVKEAKRTIRAAASRLRQEFAEGIEDAFDTNNPYSRGSLVATVRGEDLVVKMRGNFEGRRRHSQDQVDAWCSQTELFKTISLHNAHGTFTCSAGGSLKAIEAAILTEEGLLPPWTPPIAGENPTPAPVAAPPPAGGPAKIQLAEEAASLKAELDAAEAEVARRRDEHERASAALTRSERRAEEADAKHRQQLAESARTTQLAGLIVTGTGGILTSVGAYLAYQRIDVKAQIDAAKNAGPLGPIVDLDALETKYERQTTGIAVGIGVGIPLIAVGVALLVVGKRRKDAATALTLGPRGLQLEF
ncbi:MAG: hypothetical protein KC420_21325, partial [Myxococcales bacterium]|nr:hypothetical protein [Myxococcales bacterium]